ncbi:mitochondrial import inner membrane translocase subunit tim54 [Coemansia spiralis]|uniref:Mitochondrial import inner membrane translocase subunit TIM54 n=1 Tax=Coemansia spiralis TaxID=417178 RepID=A0A9W8GAD3_9FUNG|nr:mitochondrial import inner membrane translocase subunit Tim54 [Coemansia spiralis]KAJ2679499.1 mitochondrial import inner membrane translocase subunit tim54 [Coemansia spiralis]
MLTKIRKHLPGRNASIFWGAVLGTVGFYQYNKHESKKRLEYYCKRAELMANEPIGALETPRKVHVYIAVPMGELGTRKARLHWEKYILPVFVAGALDYEVTLVNDTETDDKGENERAVRGGVHNKVAEEIREHRRKELEEDNEELKQWRVAIEERKKDNEERIRKNKLGASGGSVEFDLSNWKPEPYPGVMDVVAIGRETWIEVINGINDGAVASLNYTIPPLVPLDSEQQELKESMAERKISTTTESSPSEEEGDKKTSVHVTDTIGAVVDEPAIKVPEATPVAVDYDRYASKPSSGVLNNLPAVAYISHVNLTGWSCMPQRIWNFFHNQQNVDEYARQALQVVFESTQRAARSAEEIVEMGKAEEETKGWEGQEHIPVVVSPSVVESLRIYDTQHDNAPLIPGEKESE